MVSATAIFVYLMVFATAIFAFTTFFGFCVLPYAAHCISMKHASNDRTIY